MQYFLNMFAWAGDGKTIEQREVVDCWPLHGIAPISAKIKVMSGSALE